MKGKASDNINRTDPARPGKGDKKLKRSTRARKEGKAARYAGQPIKPCPYKGKLAFNWREGWREANKEIAKKHQRGSVGALFGILI